MRILDPRQFLRVEEKFFPAFALFDDALDTPALLAVYVALWHFACKRSRPTQVELARCSKCGLRSLQSNLSTLEKRGYIAIRKEGGRNCYDLVLSPQVVSELLHQGVEYQNTSFYIQEDAQILRIEHANSAPSLKDLKSIKKKNTPLSPRSNGLAPDTRYRVGSLRPAYPAHGRGDSTHSGQLKPPCRHSLGDDWSEASSFQKLWAAWPVHQAEAPARRMFSSLVRKGVLPDLDTLLAVVERFKAHDFRWRDGGRYVPQLANWLRDERWKDEPLMPCTQVAVQEMPVAPVTAKQDEMSVYAMKEKENLSISPETLGLLASNSWMSKKALDNLQAHCMEITHEQGKTEYAPIPGHGKSGVSGLSAGDSDHAGARFYAYHDLLQPEKRRKNNHKPLPVLAALVGQEWNNCSPTTPFTSIFAAPKAGVGTYAQT